MNGTSPGELVLHSLLRQFSSVCQTKVERALADRGEKNLAKSMRIYEDSAYQQLLAALSTCAEYALPSLLQTLTRWYDFQHSTGSAFPGHQNASKEAFVSPRTLPSAAAPPKNHSDGKTPQRDQLIRSMQTDSALKASCPTLATDQPNGPDTASAATATANASWLLMSSSEREALGERRDLSIDILYCQALTSVLKQLSFHPGHDDIINKILHQAFKHFEYKDNLQSSENKQNINLVADMYAEVVGELTQTRFALVRQHFTEKLARLRAKESSSFTTHSIISLLMGMKFFRVKMHPIEEFVSYFEFLHELGQYFLEVKEKEIRHAMAGLFVEVLLPVAAVARHEVNIPALKSFVDLLYSSTYDLANKKKHVLAVFYSANRSQVRLMALFPMVTCLLCISTKSFFLNNWPPFMSLCLSQLKSRDLGRVSLESLFRLLW
ncbi:unnamed protein product [Schistocephalus solidus]|uniref:MOR2-PAG1_N domain-containing protein n=1 Tax=Schistocephalus solidus TaxID=70667 RepID=A0A183TE35_SCHSO|nr:unnamed protein product [Schistocephalus solidus]